MAKGAAKEADSPVTDIKTKPQGGLKKIVIMALLGLVLLGGGVLGYLWLTDEPPAGKEAQASPVSSKHLVFLTLDPFLVNLADKENRRYLKLKVELEVAGEKQVKELEKFIPRIRDGVILLLSNKTYLDIATIEGKRQLKQEIMKSITALPPGKHVSDIFFTEFVAQ